ncbi:MAG TPA: hypothetical protein VFH61_09190 [Thermoleophilia bacterium]|nr:hypothetical protein [Thermoleophilia bacterium]
MALTANQVAALNNLKEHVPQLKHQATSNEPINLGDELELKSYKVATIASPDGAAAAGAAPDAAEHLVLVTLLNEIKAALNAIA